MVRYGFLDAKAEFVGFGSRRLVSNEFLCAKAPLDPLCRFFVAQSFGGQSLSSRPSRRRVEGSCIGFWKSKANSTFCKVVKQKGEAFWPPLQSVFAKDTAFLSAKAQKLQNSAKPNSGTVRRFSPLKPAFFFGALAWGFREVKAL